MVEGYLLDELMETWQRIRQLEAIKEGKDNG